MKQSIKLVPLLLLFFMAISLHSQNTKSPCLEDPNYKRFDFWVGNWDIYVKDKKVAENTITHARGNCAILEDYQTLGATGGNSLSYYDTLSQKWQQTYTDTAGNVSYYIESNKPYEGDLQFISKSTISKGKESRNFWIKMTYYKNKDGSVRQFLETSVNEGKTWTSNWDGLYRKKSSEETK